MFVLGITGGIGTGKSVVASICRAAGIQVIDADDIAHELTDRASNTTARIAEVLGSDLIDDSGALLRGKMADLAFTNKRALDALSAIVHEDVVAAVDTRLKEAEKKKVKAVVLDAPIPVERGFIDHADQIWAITANENVRLERLRKRGMSDADALRRMRVQMSPEQYRKIAHFEIENNGTLLELEEKVHKLLRQEFGLRGIPLPGIPDSSAD
ncbi:MAG TPA: dephospho-CoA kinase [Clostridiaceae bacterium]|nr:dephospho-CoA kinase [Clostridiaceae bacterium]